MPSQKDKDKFGELVAEYNRNPSKTSAINIFDKYLNESANAEVRFPLKWDLYYPIRQEVLKYKRWLEERNTNFSSFFSRIARSASSTPYKARPNIFDPVLGTFDPVLGTKEKVDPFIIHYIWWGPFETVGRDVEVIFNGPNQMAEKITANCSIYFWCGQKFLDEYLKDCKERNPVIWESTPPSGIPKLHESILVKVIRFETTLIDKGAVIADTEKRGYQYEWERMMENPLAPDFSSLALGNTAKLDALETNSVLKGALETLMRLDQYDTRAALKDLMVLVVLYLHGGLFLDTTSRLPDTAEIKAHNMRDINDCLADLKNRRYPCVPSLYNLVRGAVVPEKTLDFQPGVKTTHQIVNGTDWSKNMESKGRKPNFDMMSSADNRESWMGLELPHIEVWAAFSNSAGHCIFLAIDSYVDRMARMGISKSGIPLNRNSVVTGINTSDNDFGHVLMTRAKIGNQPRDRDAFIGSVITSSYYDGFIGNGFSPTKFENVITWQAITINEPHKHCIVPSLGIVKYYGNTWRI